MSKSDEYGRERAKLLELFKDIDPAKKQLVEGLVEDAAFLKVQNDELKTKLRDSGMVLINPRNPNQQRPIEAARQYLKNVNSYAVIIKTLNSVLNKNGLDDDDDLEDFE